MDEQPDQVMSDIDDCNYVQPSNIETKASSSKYDDVTKQQEEGKLEIPVKKKFKEMRDKRTRNLNIRAQQQRRIHGVKY